MRQWLLRAQSGLKRAIGNRQLRQGNDEKSDAGFAAVAAQLDILGGEAAEWRHASTQRWEAVERLAADLQIAVATIRIELSGQGRSDTERGETVDNMLRDLRAAVSDMGANWNGKNLEQSLGDLRVELSGVRADLAREMEMMSDRIDALAGPGDRTALSS